MSKHILDRPRGHSGSRLAQFLMLERTAHPHGVTRMLHQRKREAVECNSAPRLAIYTGIERRKEA
ncbi:MAG: hypothetical protein HLUCCA12_12745 [Rhodobacteraceae bacterium HLUCCA12]|nr:MAG: hypothetical protein HLUCCA12_12745 [Rhodobacteraceae bacterium HLUCCA12]